MADNCGVLRARLLRKVIVNRSVQADGSSLWRFRTVPIASAAENNRKLRKTYARLAAGDGTYDDIVGTDVDAHTEAHAAAVGHHQARVRSLRTDAR